MTTKTNRKDKNEVIASTVEATLNASSTKSSNPDDGYHFLITKGEASKITPKSTGRIFYQLAINQEDQQLYLRIDSNEGGGLHSREWISLASLVSLLTEQGDRPFTSSLFRQAIKGKSSNNASFVACILRSEEMQFIRPHEKGLFQHQVHTQLDERYQSLLALASTHNEKAS